MKNSKNRQISKWGLMGLKLGLNGLKLQYYRVDPSLDGNTDKLTFSSVVPLGQQDNINLTLTVDSLGLFLFP